MLLISSFIPNVQKSLRTPLRIWNGIAPVDGGNCEKTAYLKTEEQLIVIIQEEETWRLD